jgi:Na+-translocating ferredoxin:NAD+ oxidoreductase RnfC subunit
VFLPFHIGFSVSACILPQSKKNDKIGMIILLSVTDLIALFRAFIRDKPALRRTVGTNGSA